MRKIFVRVARKNGHTKRGQRQEFFADPEYDVVRCYLLSSRTSSVA